MYYIIWYIVGYRRQLMPRYKFQRCMHGMDDARKACPCTTPFILCDGCHIPGCTRCIAGDPCSALGPRRLRYFSASWNLQYNPPSSLKPWVMQPTCSPNRSQSTSKATPLIFLSNKVKTPPPPPFLTLYRMSVTRTSHVVAPPTVKKKKKNCERCSQNE